ncbi:MAG TPA: SUKH-4 family immunity protein [Candidatus Xenobia bacterium]|jgi:hypothetical protein
MNDDRTRPGGEGPWRKVPAGDPALLRFPPAVQEFLTQVGLPDSPQLGLRFDLSFEPVDGLWKVGSDATGALCLDANGALWCMHADGTRFINSTPHLFFMCRLAYRNRELSEARSEAEVQQADDALAAHIARVDPPAMAADAWWPRLLEGSQE